MERLYNHVADFGMISNDTGFAMAHSQCFRIRESLLRLNKRLTGNRLLRGSMPPGGVAHDLPAGLNLAAELDAILADFNEVVDISLDNTMLFDRLEGHRAPDPGIPLPITACWASWRAPNLDIDRDVAATIPLPPTGISVFQCRSTTPAMSMRAPWCGWKRCARRVQLIQQALAVLPAGPLSAPLGALPAWEPAFGLVEGWRGRSCTG